MDQRPLIETLRTRGASLRAFVKFSPRTRVAWIGAALAGIVLLSGAAFFGLRREPLPAQVIYGSGRIEADEVRVGVEVSGRLLEVNAIEGASVERGALVARVDASDYELQRASAAADQRAASQVVAQLGSQIDLAHHHAATARTDLERYESLSRQGFATPQRVDLARNAYREAADQEGVLRERRGQAQAQAESAAALAALARSRIDKTRILAPRAGIVLERLVEPGEVVAPGQPLVIIADLSTVRLRIFINERDLGKVRLGAPARIRVDAFPERFFIARVSQVDAAAQFTPRDVHTADERSRTVYGVTLEAENAGALLKPGMPADAWILWDQGAQWPARLSAPE
ncbi:MAG TPA: efflux RND transporter periplasmic adaptor subunit [Caulobacterales bacterium]|nr:efflux RND transporter periplasmic adaptor subunit [Caulobacterales bacterium]